MMMHDLHLQVVLRGAEDAAAVDPILPPLPELQAQNRQSDPDYKSGYAPERSSGASTAAQQQRDAALSARYFQGNAVLVDALAANPPEVSTFASTENYVVHSVFTVCQLYLLTASFSS